MNPDRRPLDILVVDDHAANVTLLCEFIKAEGHRPFPASSGAQALAQIQQQMPDLVLLDLMMPEMDGLETCRRIRSLCQEIWLPVIFITARQGDDGLIEALDHGGDDYLTKPVNLRVLRAKIQVMQRIRNAQAELRQVNQLMQAQLTMAHEVVDHLLEYAYQPLPGLECVLHETEQVSGDALLARRSPSGVNYLLLGDATYHGLSAAITLMPVAPAFVRGVDQELGLAQLVRNLNRKARAVMPVNRFLAATLICHDPQQGRLEVWNGGCPPVLLRAADGRIVERFASGDPALRLNPDSHFYPQTEVCSWTPGGEIFLYSDGLMDAVGDATDFDATAWLRQLAAATPPTVSLCQAVEQRLRAQIDFTRLGDDISFASFRPDSACTAGLS